MAEILYTICAGLYLLLAAVILFGARAGRTDAIMAAGCLVTASWAAACAFGAVGLYGYVGALELAVSVAWYGFILCLYHRAVEGGSRLHLVFNSVGVAAVLIVMASLAHAGYAGGDAGMIASFGSLEVDIRLGLAVCAILLIENLYRNASADLRWHVALPCIALGGLYIYNILFYGDAVLFRRLSPTLSDGRAVITILVAPLLALSVGRNRRRWGGSIQVSRNVVLHTASLVVAGIFLLALATVGEVLRLLGSDRQGDWGMVLEVSLVCGGLLTAGVFLTSGSARSKLRSLIVDNFFTQRYDYRVEWLRCIATLSQPGDTLALHTRAIRALSQVVDSPSGLLFLREPDGGVFRWAGSWNLPPTTLQIDAGHQLLPLFRGGRWVVVASEDTSWSLGIADPWLAVPLSHAGRLTGFALVSKPRAAFVLDREVFDLLRIIGQEVAGHVAEQQAAATLLQTRQLREYGQRFAFVAHDIKNVASQLSLLLSNAERHISNPEFQKDMLGTVGGSVQKITGLLARLKAPEDAPGTARLVPAARVGAVVTARDSEQRCRIRLSDGTAANGKWRADAGAGISGAKIPGSAENLIVRMAPSAFDAVLVHLLDNAFEASADNAEIQVRLLQEGPRLCIDIIDFGCGMSPEFIRDRLFHPFNSSKRDGFGLGVYQARELLRQVGGDLLVISALGSGTTMRLSLPIVAAEASPGLALPATVSQQADGGV